MLPHHRRDVPLPLEEARVVDGQAGPPPDVPDQRQLVRAERAVRVGARDGQGAHDLPGRAERHHGRGGGAQQVQEPVHRGPRVLGRHRDLLVRQQQRLVPAQDPRQHGAAGLGDEGGVVPPALRVALAPLRADDRDPPHPVLALPQIHGHPVAQPGDDQASEPVQRLLGLQRLRQHVRDLLHQDQPLRQVLHGRQVRGLVVALLALLVGLAEQRQHRGRLAAPDDRRTGPADRQEGAVPAQEAVGRHLCHPRLRQHGDQRALLAGGERSVAPAVQELVEVLADDRAAREADQLERMRVDGRDEPFPVGEDHPGLEAVERGQQFLGFHRHGFGHVCRRLLSARW